MGPINNIKITHEAGDEFKVNPAQQTKKALPFEKWGIIEAGNRNEITAPPSSSDLVTSVANSALSAANGFVGGACYIGSGALSIYYGTKKFVNCSKEVTEQGLKALSEVATPKEELTKMLSRFSALPAGGIVYLNGAPIVYEVLKQGAMLAIGRGFVGQIGSSLIAASALPTALPMVAGGAMVITPTVVVIAKNLATRYFFPNEESNISERTATVTAIEDVSDANLIASEAANTRTFSDDNAGIAFNTYQKLKNKGSDLTQNDFNNAVKAAEKSKSGDISVDVGEVEALLQWIEQNHDELKQGFISAGISEEQFNETISLIERATA